MQQEFQDIANQVVNRLRALLHQRKLTAYYFTGDGRQAVSFTFWATTAADGTMVSGTYWPFGEPTQLYQSRPNYPLFLLQSELDALLIEQPDKKRPFPKARISDLAAVLRTLDHLPSRKAQFQAVCNMPEFREYEITNSVFREAARQAPRRPGRPKSRR